MILEVSILGELFLLRSNKWYVNNKLVLVCKLISHYATETAL